jgi:GntR family transcriptional regulator/MocR family aminotransferase
MVSRLLLNPCDRVPVEDPGFQGAHAAFHAAGAAITSVGVDGQGFAPTAGQVAQSRMIYLTPAHQFPTAVTMTLQRRLELLTWAKNSDTIILEDDYDSDFRYCGRPVPAIQGLDQSGSVILAGSFNKSLFPALRLGYLVLPSRLVEIVTATKSISTRHQPILDQVVLAAFISEGLFGAHIRRMRRIYSERHHCLVHHIREKLASLLEVSAVQAGLQTIATRWARTERPKRGRSCSPAQHRRRSAVPVCAFLGSGYRSLANRIRRG